MNFKLCFSTYFKNKKFKKKNIFERELKKQKIEFRRGNAGGGNQLRQPYLKNLIKKKINYKDFKNVDHIHNFGYYIGNFPDLKKKKLFKFVNFSIILKYDKKI